MKYNIVKNILTIILIIFLSYFAFKMHDAKNILDEATVDILKLKEHSKTMEDSVKALNALNQTYVLEISKNRASLDSISKVKNKTIIRYRDQKKFVSDANIHQLDSIIRANTTIGF